MRATSTYRVNPPGASRGWGTSRTCPQGQGLLLGTRVLQHSLLTDAACTLCFNLAILRKVVVPCLQVCPVGRVPGPGLVQPGLDSSLPTEPAVPRTTSGALRKCQPAPIMQEGCSPSVGLHLQAERPSSPYDWSAGWSQLCDTMCCQP